MIITRGYGDNSLIITRGYGTSIVVELLIKILPQFITRRATFTNIVRRVSLSKVVRREDD
jgi:hypothetical protein